MVVDKVRKGVWWLFLKIEEPRLVRILQFFLYGTMIIIGSLYLISRHMQVASLLGATLATTLGVLVVLGGILGGIAVLPGIWWVERMGIICLWTGLGIYIVVGLSIYVSLLGVGLAWALIFALAIRWVQIKDFQFAPGR